MNGTDRSLYNYCINDLEKIKFEKKLIEKSLSKQKMKILIKKYPYDYQKYINENYIKFNSRNIIILTIMIKL